MDCQTVTRQTKVEEIVFGKLFNSVKKHTSLHYD